MFSKSEVAVINAARTMLRALEAEARDVALDADEKHDAMDYGRLAEAIDNAEGALFNVLNVADSYCGARLTYEQLHMRPKDEEES